MDERIVCDKCDGTGRLSFIEPNKNRQAFPISCKKCGGTGFFDWIENIVGKHQYIKPGVYVKEIDLSKIVSESETLTDEES